MEKQCPNYQSCNAVEALQFAKRIFGKGDKATNDLFGVDNSKKQQYAEVLVVGAGMSGTSAAFNLHKNGVDVILAEVNDYVGGNIVSKNLKDGFQWEEGPYAFQPDPIMLRFLKDIDMLDKLVVSDPSLPRLVVITHYILF